MIVGTGLLLDYFRGDEGARSMLELIIDGSTTASICPITVYSLWKNSSFDRKAEIACVGLLSLLEEAPLSVAAARQAATWLRSSVVSSGDCLREYVLLAAVAQERGEAVCTRDADFISPYYANIITY